MSSLVPSVAYEDERLIIHRVVVGDLANNVYVIKSKSTDEAVLIDAAAQGDELLTWAQEHNVSQVLTTHGHWDHIGAVPEFRKALLTVGIGSGPDDSDQIDHDFELSDKQRFTLGDVAIEAIATPGHTSGSFCFAIIDAPIIFTGDTLFPGGPGATRSATSSFPTIIESITTRIFDVFDDDVQILPGHGLPTTVGTERPSLQDWISRGW